MKPMKIFRLTALIAFTLVISCSKILEEEPRSIYEPGYFATESGIQGGLTAMYAHLRYIYGQAYYFGSCIVGTDEYTYGALNNGNFLQLDFTGAAELNASNSRADVLWNEAFPNINTASGIIENATEAGMDVSLIAEARFFRAFDYFQLVQTFGGVPLDLGAGELKFNSSSARTSVRNTVPEVYTRGIFPDLKTAVTDLPDKGRLTGAATKTLARLYLAKAYLTYGWWLENPNSIPTYPECARTDPDGHPASWYYQQAYDVATAAIANPGDFKLQPTFYEVNATANDRNDEILLYADHTGTSEFYNGSNFGYLSPDVSANYAHWMTQWNYAQIAGGAIVREIIQWGGRPWSAIAPTQEALTNTFAEKTNDSRYDGTFTTVYRANWNKFSGGTGTKTMANDMPIGLDSAILTFLPDESLAASITYPAGDAGAGPSGVSAGTIAGRADYVLTPSAICRVIFPGLWKIGPRHSETVSGYGDNGAASVRPFNIAKFSELYFIAAEAAVKGATGSQSARDLINVIRTRAGKWAFSNAENVAKTDDNSAALVAATPATIGINYILAERSREYFGECYRWFDLVRTQKWNELAGSYSICETGTAYSHIAPTTKTRTIKPTHYLRPIPIGQLDGLEMTDAAKAAYQNPGYN
jgi:hypothetical protein